MKTLLLNYRNANWIQKTSVEFLFCLKVYHDKRIAEKQKITSSTSAVKVELVGFDSLNVTK